VLRWDEELDRRRAERDGVRAGGVPDLEVSAGVRHLRGDGDTALRVGVAAPLPLFDRKRDAARAAEARIARGAAERREAEVRLAAEVADTQAALAATADEATALRERILPPAAAALAEAEDAYRRGRLRLTDVLDAKRTYFRLRERQVDVLTRHHAAAARLERLLGAPLHETPARKEG
jgi:cobalt-zinc-cadmium efflux system outer membrane protein